MRSTAWTDDRLDDLNRKVDRVDANVDDLRRHMDVRFEAMESRMDSRFDSMQRAMFHAAVILAGSVLTAGAAIVATQL